MEVVPARRRVEMPTVNASGCPPNLLWEGGREEEVDFTAQENHDSQTRGGLEMDGKLRGNPGKPISQGEGHPGGTHRLL